MSPNYAEMCSSHLYSWGIYAFKVDQIQVLFILHPSLCICLLGAGSKPSQALEGTVLEGSEVTIPGSIQKMTGHGTYCYGLADIVVIKAWTQ